MGLIHSTLCALSFMLERVFTWFSCAMCSICLLFAMMSMCIYGISVGYHYAQKEIAQWTEPYRQYHGLFPNRKETVGIPGAGLIRNIWNLMWSMPRFMLWEIPKFFLLEAPSYLLNLLPLNLLPYNPLGRRRSAGGGNSTVVAAPGLYPAMQSPQPGEGDPRAPWYPSVSPPVWYSVDTSAPPRPMQDNATDTPFPWAIGLNEESKIPSLSEDFENEEKSEKQSESVPKAPPPEQKDWWNVYLPESTTLDLERNIDGLKKFLPRFRSYKASNVQKRPS